LESVILLILINIREKVNGRLPPLPWYRRIFVKIAIPLLRLVLAIMGVFWVEVKGKLVSREETPIVVSNHGTAIDGFLLTWF
jgi:1-acyl-sn-glycerol-3-phosphate acyltransferase